MLQTVEAKRSHASAAGEACVNTKICVLEMCVCYLHVQLDLFCLLYRHPAGRLRRTEALGGKSEDLSP